MNKAVNKFYIILTPVLLVLFFSPWKNIQIQEVDIENIEDELIYYLPIVYNEKDILASTSYYLPTTDANFLYSLGCEQGQQDLQKPGAQDSVAVLDFSYPVYTPELGFGAALFEDSYSYTEPASIAAIEAGVKGFAQGYYHCTGEDNYSNLVIGVGTNNKTNSIKTSELTAAHGAAWSAMVSRINQWALQEGIFHQIQAYGASNIEVGWNTPDMTRTWITGFEQSGGNFLLHFGDASGCPYEDNPHWICNNGWELEDLWYVSWGADSALPLPLIYLNDGVHAKQWAYLSQYSVAEHGYRMDFTGVFTQYQYCEQWGSATWSNCDRTDNTPEEAYLQLTTELNKYPTTAQDLRWKTDIRWVFESEVSKLVTPMEDFWKASHPIYRQIDQLKAGLETPHLSLDLQSSLRSKLNISEAIAMMIEISQQNPAQKNTPLD